MFSADFEHETSSNHFFENEAGQAATVNGARYRDTITRFFLQKLDDIDVANIRFQQANETIRLPHDTFPDHVLSRFGDQNWPPRSRDLTPLEFYLRGYSKSKVYVDNPIIALQKEIKLQKGEKFQRKGAYVPANNPILFI